MSGGGGQIEEVGQSFRIRILRPILLCFMLSRRSVTSRRLRFLDSRGSRDLRRGSYSMFMPFIEGRQRLFLRQLPWRQDSASIRLTYSVLVRYDLTLSLRTLRASCRLQVGMYLAAFLPCIFCSQNSLISLFLSYGSKSIDFTFFQNSSLCGSSSQSLSEFSPCAPLKASKLRLLTSLMSVLSRSSFLFKITPTKLLTVVQMSQPILIMSNSLMLRQLYIPNELQMVQLQGKPSLLQKTERAQFFFSLLISKLHWLSLKLGLAWLSMQGKSRLLRKYSDQGKSGGPQEKALGCEECPCRSMNILTLLYFSFLYCLKYLMMPMSSGKRWQRSDSSSTFQFLLKSCPSTPVRLLPIFTPSILTIGMMIQNILLSIFCSWFRKPSIIQLPTLQPGCCLAITTTVALLFLCQFTKRAWILLPSTLLASSTFLKGRERRSVDNRRQVQGGWQQNSTSSKLCGKSQLNFKQYFISPSSVSSYQYSTLLEIC